MTSIHVQSPGMFTTVQDLGRYGYGLLAVSPSGAADPIAFRIGNMLVGNSETAASLEMTLLGGIFIFPDGGVVAVTGSDFGATIEGAPLPMWTACPVQKGQTLKTGPTQSGARCYLSVRGGIEVTPFLDSASTHILSGLGGLDGRALRKGDILLIKDLPHPDFDLPRRVQPEILKRLEPRTVIRTTVAPQSDLFSSSTLNNFYGSRYRVTEQSNRMGLRLDGQILEAPYSGQMLSEGVSLGAVQVPSGGQPIILFVEQQTTGGYPKIANVISADLSGVGQLRPNNIIQFEQVSPEVALSLLKRQEQLFQDLSSTLTKA